LRRVIAVVGRKSHSHDYYEVLRRLHSGLRPRTYLEIGIRDGDSLALARGAAVIGIDPDPLLDPPPGPDVRIFAMTSDEFFASHDVREELGGRDLDLAFIDGMHLFENVLRDFANVERSAMPGTIVVLHDCLPRSAATAARERATRMWTGDVWKAVFVLLRYRPDLRLTVIDARPSGLVLVEGLDPRSRVIDDNAERIAAEFTDLGFGYWEEHKGEVLGLIEDLRSVLARLHSRSTP
jgi:hypothetical protein